jgi:hypothetical protein
MRLGYQAHAFCHDQTGSKFGITSSIPAASSSRESARMTPRQASTYPRSLPLCDLLRLSSENRWMLLKESRIVPARDEAKG